MNIHDLFYSKFDVLFICGLISVMIFIIGFGISKNDEKLMYEPIIIIGLTLSLPFLRMWLNSNENQKDEVEV